MSIPSDAKFVIPDDVLASDLDGQIVILNLQAESYFGLRDVGARAWTLLNEGNSVETVYETLLGEYDVDRAVLRHDLDELVDQLVERQLVTRTSA